MSDNEQHFKMNLAYTEAIQKYSKRLFEFGFRMCQDEDLVKDCLQQLFLDLWHKGFDLNEKSTIQSYLFTAIRNRVLKELAKKSKLQPLVDEHDFLLEFSIENKLIAETTTAELVEKVQKLLNNLPARQREIIYLRFYENLEIGQIAAVMNVNRQSAHNLLQKAYHKIREDWPIFVLLTSFILEFNSK